MQRTMIVLGDSNIIALAQCAQSDGIVRPWLRLDYVHNGALMQTMSLELKSGRTILNPMILRQLVSHGLCDKYSLSPLNFDGDLVILFGSVLHATLGVDPNLTLHRLPGELTLSESSSDDKSLISSGLLAAVSEQSSKSLEMALGIFRTSWPFARLILLAGPPPPRDNTKLVNTLSLTHIPSPIQRLAIHKANIAALFEHSLRNGFCFLDVPSHLRDGEGFLKPEFDSDGVHGNVLYGREVIGYLEQINTSGFGRVETIA